MKYADTKASAVLVLLGVGLLDLVTTSGRFVDAATRGVSGAVAIAFFSIGLALAMLTLAAAVTVLTPNFSLKPRRPSSSVDSLYYFEVVARKSPEAYQSEVAALDEEGLTRELGLEAWDLARVAERKFRRNTITFAFMGLFALAWVVARLCLSIATR